MSEIFAQATVRIEPDLRGFVTKLRQEIRAAIEKVEATPTARVRIAPALTRNFVGDLRRQVAAAVRQVERGAQPIRLRAVVTPPTVPRAAAVEALPAAAVAAPAAGAAAAAAASAKRAAAASAALREPMGREVSALRALERATEALARAREPVIGAAGKLEEAHIRLTRANVAVTASQRAVTAAMREGNRVLAERAQATLKAARAEQIQAAASRNAARAANRAARSQEQLLRGAQATSLSFLGIRGATLAATRSFLVGAASVAVFFKALGESSRFTNQLNVLQATTAASAEEMERVREAARALGADISLPAVTAADAAEAMTELAKAGLSVQDAIDGARGVLQLATAAAISNAQAVELTANALNAFSLQGKDATRVADVFANAANAAQGSIAEIGTAFQQAAAAASQVGLSFEETATLLTILARNGLRGSDAGTSLRTALLRLVRPTGAAAEKIRKLGIEVRDAQGNLRPDVFQQIAVATRDMSPAMRDATIALIGGQDAFRAISIIGRQPIETFLALNRQIREQGTAAELAAARSKGLRGAMDALSSTIETLGVRFGRAVSPGIRSVILEITDAVQVIDRSESSARALSGTLDFVTTSVRGAASAFGPLARAAMQAVSSLVSVANAIGVPTILAAVTAYKLLPAAIARATAALASFRATSVLAALSLAPSIRSLSDLRALLPGLGRLFNPIAIAAAAAAAAIFFFSSRQSAAEKTTQRLRGALDQLARSLSSVSASEERFAAAQRSVEIANTNLTQALINQRRAQQELEASRAPRGSIELVQLQNNLKVATQELTFAYEDQARAVRELNEAQEELAFSRSQVAQTQQEVISGIMRQIEIARNISRAIAARGGLTRAEAEARARERIAEALRREAEILRASEDQQRRAIGARIALLARLFAQIKGAPTAKEIRLLIRDESLKRVLRRLAPLFGVEGTRAASLFSERVMEGIVRGLSVEQAVRKALRLLPVLMAEEGARAADAFARGLASGLDQATPRMEKKTAGLAKRLGGRLMGLEREETTLRIAGASPAAFLENLRRREEILRRQIAAMKPGPSRERARQELADVLEEQRRIEEELREQARRRREEQDRRLIEELGFRRERVRERILDAQQTADLRDDIQANRAFRQLVLRQIEIVRERVKTEELRIQTIRELRRISRDVAREIRRLQEERRAQVRERIAESIALDIELARITQRQDLELRARQAEIQRLRKLISETKRGTVDYKRYRNAIAEHRNAIRGIIAESIALDIEFARITGRRALEIRLREREIRRLQRLMAETKRGTLEYKRHRNAIAEHRRAIAELRREIDERDRAFRELVFRQLQRQQGFAARLLGNLIPLGAGEGLVGPRPVPVEEAVTTPLRRQAALIEAQRVGPTRGQATVEIDLLRQILQVLREIQRGRAHPAAREASVRQRAAMEVM